MHCLSLPRTISHDSSDGSCFNLRMFSSVILLTFTVFSLFFLCGSTLPLVDIQVNGQINRLLTAHKRYLYQECLLIILSIHVAVFLVSGVCTECFLFSR